MLAQVAKYASRLVATEAQADSWMSASDLLKLTMAAKQHAEQQYHRLGATAATSRQLHDAALACMMFGYMPPLRLACLRTLTHPSYQGPCIHPDCIRPGCRGNRLIVRQRQPLQLDIDLQHHKNVGSHGYKPIHITVPAGLAELLYLFVGMPRKVLTQHLPEQCPFLFVNKAGSGFDDSQLSPYWSAWLTAQGGSHMAPSKLRQVFVGERRSNDKVLGPSDAGAARVMGHSPEQWTKWYDVHFHDRETQNAVDAMATWRQQLLQLSAQPSTQPSTSAVHAAAMQRAAIDSDDDDSLVIVL